VSYLPLQAYVLSNGTLYAQYVLIILNFPNLVDISDLEDVKVDTLFTRGSKMNRADIPEHLR